jgi:hypothetical protein
MGIGMRQELVEKHYGRKVPNSAIDSTTIPKRTFPFDLGRQSQYNHCQSTLISKQNKIRK